MSDDLMKRLRRKVNTSPFVGKRFACTVNPDGPEAADRIAALEAALKPFATESDEWSDEILAHAAPMISDPSGGPTCEAKFTFGDLRRAKAALEV
jgi:hypothetical protein